MNIVVAIIGWIIVAEGLLGIARPRLVLEAVLGWSSELLLYITVSTRIVLGLLLVLAASDCHLPRFTRTIGVITFLAGLAYVFIQGSGIVSMVQWILSKPNIVIQTLYLLATILGGLLVYSGSKRKTSST
jgi:hypothetical protein